MNIGQQASLQTWSSPSLNASLDQIRRPNTLFTLPRPSFAATTSNSSLLLPAEEKTSVEDLKPFDNNSSNWITCVPFPLCSVNLITCSSNSGKTHFLNQVIRHRHRFFESSTSIKRIVFINGNQRDLSVQHPWTVDSDNPSDTETSIDLEVLSLSLDDFTDIATILQPRDILILDDILKVNEDIQFIIKYGAHHYSLSAVFVVTQSCLSSPLYSLLSPVHSIVLLFGNSTTTRLAQHLVQFFFFCSETKKYLKSIFALAEKTHDTVILKLNTIASNRFHSNILAFTRVQGLFVEPPKVAYCFMYPELSHIESLSQKMPDSNVAELPLEGEYLKEAFVLVPVHRVRQVQQAEAQGGNSSSQLCGSDKEKEWIAFNRYLKTEIESAFPFRRWTPAMNLAREILQCDDFCISSDFRTISTKQNQKRLFSIIDFLNIATRKAGPGENRDKVNQYRPLVQVLLKNNIPQTFIINKLLLPGPSDSRRNNNRMKRSYVM